MDLRSSITPQQLFSNVSRPNIQRSTFPRNHFRSGTFDASVLVPLTWDLVYPGDTMQMSVSGAIRYNTLIKPINANQYCDIFAFFVPCRLIHDNFERMMGAQDDPDDSIDFVTPKIEIPAGGFDFGTNYDSLGVPPGRGDGVEILAYPLRAIFKTYNRWFRDENLQDSVYCPTDDGPDIAANYAEFLPRGKRKDQYTSALPSPQKGDAITLPVGDLAPIVGLGKYNLNGSTDVQSYETDNSTVQSYSYGQDIGGATSDLNHALSVQTDEDGYPLIYANLAAATGVSINAFREYNMLQVYLENDARGGTRYNELTYSHFGVISPDARVQDPELIGYYSTLVDVTAIPQQGESGSTPQGNLAAMGNINFLNGFLYNKTFTEHGITFCLASVRTDQVYQQGLNRNWSISSRFDFYSPEFAHLGEDSILNQELYLQGAANVDDDGNEINKLPFGYQERWYHMRYMESYVFDQYRSEHSTPLDSWHLAQEFDSLPVLNSDFIIEDAPIERVVSLTEYPDFNGEFYFDYKCTRPMPVRSIPSLMDRI
jgi:hypothetical protein